MIAIQAAAGIGDLLRQPYILLGICRCHIPDTIHDRLGNSFNYTGFALHHAMAKRVGLLRQTAFTPDDFSYIIE